MLARALMVVVASLIVVCGAASAQREMTASEVRRHNEMVLRLKKQSKWNSGTAPAGVRPVFRTSDGRDYLPPVEQVTVVSVGKSAVVIQRRDRSRFLIHYRSPKGRIDFLPRDIALIHSPGPFGAKGSSLFLPRAFEDANIIRVERAR